MKVIWTPESERTFNENIDYLAESWPLKSIHSRNTLKKDLQYLVREGLLLMTGSGRGSRYHYQEKS